MWIFCQILNANFENCQSSKISPNLVTLSSTHTTLETTQLFVDWWSNQEGLLGAILNLTDVVSFEQPCKLLSHSTKQYWAHGGQQILFTIRTTLKFWEEREREVLVVFYLKEFNLKMCGSKSINSSSRHVLSKIRINGPSRFSGLLLYSLLQRRMAARLFCEVEVFLFHYCPVINVINLSFVTVVNPFSSGSRKYSGTC